MIPQIKTILYATDLSENSAYAFCYALNSAKKHNAKIIILHVLEQMPAMAEALSLSYIPAEKSREIQEEKESHAMNLIQERLKIFCEKELKGDPECTGRVESIEVFEGFPPDIILRMANERNCDVIVMGAHARGAIANAFLGSTAKRVLRRTMIPVFIIPLPKGEIDITFHSI